MNDLEQLFTFEELREIAIKDGISDNKVSVGLWAKIKGYKKAKREIRNNKFIYLYSISPLKITI